MRIFIAALLLIVSFACSDHGPENNCVSTSKALDDISSLSNIVNHGKVAGRPSCTVYAGARIFSCQYQGNHLYYFSNPASSMAECGFIAYDCYGEEIMNRASSASEWDAFAEGRTEEEMLWQRD